MTKPIKQQILAIMADGRERTSEELARSVGLQPKEITGMLRAMKAGGKLTSDMIPADPGYVTAWRIVKEQAA